MQQNISAQVTKHKQNIFDIMSNCKPQELNATYVRNRLISATFGGTITALVVTPLDVVKARLQAQRKTLITSNSANNSNYLLGTVDAFKKIAKYEGISALWKGLYPTFAITVPASALYFTLYESLRDSMTKRISTDSAFLPFVVPASGIVARSITVAVINPVELVRTSLQANKGRSTTGIWSSWKQVVRHKGVIGLWAGLVPTLWRDVPFSALYWFSFETFKKKLHYNNNIHCADNSTEKQQQKKFFFDFASGASAGMIASLVTNPVDVIKTRRQMNLTTGATQTTTLRSISKELLAEEGWRGFFKGALPRAARVAPACAIMISSYELCKTFFEQK